jgi:hypothetical protein
MRLRWRHRLGPEQIRRPARGGCLDGSCPAGLDQDQPGDMAYVEICTDEKAQTAMGVLHLAVALFAEAAPHIERVLSPPSAARP